MTSKDLDSIEVASGVNEEGKPFVHIFAHSGKDIWIAQQTPAEIRSIAMHWLEAAEAAEQDAIVYKMLRNDVEMPLPAISAFVARMREMRENL